MTVDTEFELNMPDGKIIAVFAQCQILKEARNHLLGKHDQDLSRKDLQIIYRHAKHALAPFKSVSGNGPIQVEVAIIKSMLAVAFSEGIRHGRKENRK